MWEQMFPQPLAELFPQSLGELFPQSLAELFPQSLAELFPQPLAELFPQPLSEWHTIHNLASGPLSFIRQDARNILMAGVTSNW